MMMAWRGKRGSLEVATYYRLMYDGDPNDDTDDYGTFLLNDVYRAKWSTSRAGFVSDDGANGNLCRRLRVSALAY